MRLVYASAFALAILALVPTVYGQDAAQSVANGGIFVSGWQGKIDANEVKAGMTLNNARLADFGIGMKVTTGPAVNYWNPKNVAQGNYTVKAMFNEPLYMNLNNHPHPYGIFIGGNDMGTDNQSLVYCAAYGNGNFIVRGFSPAPFQMNGRGAPAPSVNKAAGPKMPVTQEIAMTVKGDSVECSINGAVVATYPKTDLVAAGKLKSTDGVYGIRFAHNTEAIVTGFGMTKN